MKRLNQGETTALTPFASITSTDQAMSDVEEELEMILRKGRGKRKAKMRYLPELPEEVWTRVFELYYEEIAEG